MACRGALRYRAWRPRGRTPMNDLHLREHALGGVLLSKGSFLEVRRDDVRLPDGSHATREYVVHPGAVAIVPLLDDGRLVLERQFRYPVGRVLLEIPGRQDRPGRGHAGLRQARAARGDRLPRPRMGPRRRGAQRGGLFDRRHRDLVRARPAPAPSGWTWASSWSCA